VDSTPDKASGKASSKAPDNESSPRFVVLNMGRQKRRKIKQLERGKGALANAVTESIEELKSDGTLTHHPHTVVVVVVKQKRKRQRLPFLGSW
jgi:hypothetical protein